MVRHLLFLIRATGSEHAERLGLPQASPDSAKDGGREPFLVNRSDVVLVHQAPRSLFGRPVVAARLVEVQDLTSSHDCFGVLYGERCPLND